jgi:hypothetical protein
MQMASRTISKIRPESAAIAAPSEVPDHADVNYIRGFLSQVKPLEGNEVQDEYFEGRSLIERLALALEVNTKGYHWDATQCATVLGFLTLIQPVKGACFCDDRSYSIHNATCGFHVILYFARDQMRRMATWEPKVRKRASSVAEVAHG